MAVVKYECGCVGIPVGDPNLKRFILLSNCEGVGNVMTLDTMGRKIDRELDIKEINEVIREIQDLIEDGKNLRKLKSWMQED